MAVATKDWTDYRTGQEIYFVPDRGNPRTMVVKSVGRKWCRFEGVRSDWQVQLPPVGLPTEGFHLTSFVEKGETRVKEKNWGGIGFLYESQSAYEQDKARKDEFFALCKKLRVVNWEKLPVENLREIAAIIDRSRQCGN